MMLQLAVEARTMSFIDESIAARVQRRNDLTSLTQHADSDSDWLAHSIAAKGTQRLPWWAPMATA